MVVQCMGLHPYHALLQFLHLFVNYPELRVALCKGGVYGFGCPNVIHNGQQADVQRLCQELLKDR